MERLVLEISLRELAGWCGSVTGRALVLLVVVVCFSWPGAVLATPPSSEQVASPVHRCLVFSADGVDSSVEVGEEAGTGDSSADRVVRFSLPVNWDREPMSRLERWKISQLANKRHYHDCDDASWDEGDDDTAVLVVRISPSLLERTRRVSLSLSDPSAVRIFDAEKEAVLGPFIQDGDEPPDTWETPVDESSGAHELVFHVEGVAAGHSNLVLKCLDAQGKPVWEERAELSVIFVNVATDADNDGEIEEPDDIIENGLPDGVFVGTNLDDDDNPGIQDRSDDRSITENDHEDMETFRLSMQPWEDIDKVVLRKQEFGNAEIRIFKAVGNEYHEVLGPLAQEADITGLIREANGELDLFFEGVNVGVCRYRFEAHANGWCFADEAIAHVVQFRWVRFGDNPGPLPRYRGEKKVGPPTYTTAAPVPDEVE